MQTLEQSFLTTLTCCFVAMSSFMVLLFACLLTLQFSSGCWSLVACHYFMFVNIGLYLLIMKTSDALK